MITKDRPRLGAVPAWSHHDQHADSRVRYLLLAAILVLAGVLRFWHLTSRGLVYWDEGKFALEGLRLQWAVGHLLGGNAPLTGRAVGTAKPTHALLGALAYALLGVHDYGLLLVNATCSLVAVLLVFLVARRLFDSTVGLLAALLLAVSEYDVIYARSALSESDATMFLLAGVLIWVYSMPRSGREWERPVWLWPLLAGAAMGVGFTVNYRLLIYIAAIMVFDVLWSAHAVGWQPSLRRASLWIAGLCLTPLCWQVLGLVGDATGIPLFRADVGGASTSYLREVVYQLHEGKQSALHFRPLPYLQWYVVRESWPLFLLTLLGLGLALWRRSWPWLVPSVAVLPPYLVYIFAPFVVPRNLTPLLPFASVLAAAAVVEPARRLRNRATRLAAVLLVALLFGGYETSASWRLSEVRSGFAQAAGYLAGHGGRAVSSSEIMVFYLRGPGMVCRAPSFPQHIRFMTVFTRLGYRYVVLENHHTSRGTAYARAHYQRVAHFWALGSENLGESLISSENGSPPDPNAGHEYVDVYRFGQARMPSRPDTTAVCNQQRIT